jgi:hypothetical protein
VLPHGNYAFLDTGLRLRGSPVVGAESRSDTAGQRGRDLMTMLLWTRGKKKETLSVDYHESQVNLE